jgi:hypothetical protein
MLIYLDPAVLPKAEYNVGLFVSRLVGYGPMEYFICMRTFIVCVTRWFLALL